MAGFASLRPDVRTELLSRRGFLRGAVLLGAAVPMHGLLRAAAAAAATSIPAFKTVEAGQLTVAMNGDMPMTSVKDGKIIGIDGEVIGLIAERLGLKAKPSLMEWSATIEAIKTGRADVMLGSMGWTKPRAEAMAITDPIYYTSRFLVQKKGVNIDSVESLRGKTFGTVTGFTVVPEMKKVPGIKEVKLYDTSDACIRDVVAGRLDTAVLDGLVVDYLISKNPDWGLVNLSMKPHKEFPILTGRNHAVMGMNVSNCELFHAVNQGIAWAWKRGINKEMLAKYGANDPSYLKPPDGHARVGADRDDKGTVTGHCKEGYKDFSGLFS